jgi:hypothetical protein
MFNDLPIEVKVSVARTRLKSPEPEKIARETREKTRIRKNTPSHFFASSSILKPDASFYPEKVGRPLRGRRREGVRLKCGIWAFHPCQPAGPDPPNE